MSEEAKHGARRTSADRRRRYADIEQFEEIGARGYRHVFNRSYPRVYQAFEDFLRQATAHVPPPIRALDLGCGDGWTAALLAKMTTGKYAGIDTSSTALETLREVLDGCENLTGAAFHRGAEWILEPAAAVIEDVLGGSPNLLISNASWHQIHKAFPDVERVLARAIDWVVPGGRVVVGDYYYPTELSADAVEASLAWIRRETGQNPTPPAGFIEPAVLEETLRNSGLEILEQERFPANEHISLHYAIFSARRNRIRR